MFSFQDVGTNPLLYSGRFVMPSHVCLAAKRETQTLAWLADALSVLDRSRRSAGRVLRKWILRPQGRWGGNNSAKLSSPTAGNGLPEATYDALITGTCGLSAGILPASRGIYKQILRSRTCILLQCYARASASARLKFSSSGEKANERTTPPRSISASIGKAVAP